MTNIVNGVDLEALRNFVDAVKTGTISPDLRFVAKSVWTGGSWAEVTIDQFTAGAVTPDPSALSYKLQLDEPANVGGQDTAPNHLENLAAGLCGCIMAGIVTNASMFGAKVDGLEVTVEADINVLGLFGFDRSVPSTRNRISYTVKLNCDEQTVLPE
jgi:uncharacterized OsmC-like protein